MSLSRIAVHRGVPLAGAATVLALAVPVLASARATATAAGTFHYFDGAGAQHRIDTPTLMHCYPLQAGDARALNTTNVSAAISMDMACQRVVRVLHPGEGDPGDHFGSVQFHP